MSEDGEIVVFGYRYTSGGGGGTGGPGEGGGPSDHPMLHPETGGGGPGGPSRVPVDTYEQDCSTPAGAAVAISAHVRGADVYGPSDPLTTSSGNNWTQVEFGATIVRNQNGSDGAFGNEIFSNDSRGFVSLPVGAGSEVIGVWQNNPTIDNPFLVVENRYPSVFPENPNIGDWAALQTLKNIHGSGNPNYDPILFLTDQSGITRQFRLSERSYFEALTQGQKDQQVGLSERERTDACEQ